MGPTMNVVDGNFPQQHEAHEHCWHGRSTELIIPMPLRCCHCNELYPKGLVAPTSESIPQHGPYA